jgi:hypothetical protein
LTQKSGGDARVIIVNRMREKLYQGPLANRTQE